ncbi:MAG: hybrid sensor histidine kinase/response regulator, partial [Chitinivibrionales bacterium]
VNASGYYRAHNDHTSFLGTIGVIQDVTDCKKSEVQFKHLEAQLYQAQKMEVLGQLAGGIAHDFNNMLSGITGYAEIILRENKGRNGEFKDKRLAKHIQTVINASKRASELSGKLLAFSRQGKYAIKSVDMHHAINESVSLLERTIDRRVSIIRRLEAAPSLIMGDHAQVQNAIMNLAMNARDAMPDGGRLTISTRIEEIDEITQGAPLQSRRLTPGRYVVVQVEDTGMGIAKEHMEHIFEPFFTTKPEGKGTGLGLASVFSTMKNHLGEIFVQSSPQKGTTLTLYFPAQNDSGHMTGEPMVENGNNAGKGNILVVDDEKMVRDLLQHMLLELGYSVVSCENGLQARDYYAAHRENIDLVMLDVNMPVMNGIDCLRELRAIDSRVRTIVMTGYAVSDDTRKVLTSGVSGFLQKPFEYRILSRMVNQIITAAAD